MFRKKKRPAAGDEPIPVPAQLPPLEGMAAEEAAELPHRRRTRGWIVAAAFGVVLMLALVLALGGLGVYEGLRDRAVTNRQIAQEHYDLGLSHLAAGEVELAIAEFDLAMRHDPSLPGLRDHLRQAEDLALAQAVPTSEVRRDAAASLYQKAVGHYEAGALEDAVTALEELHGLDPDYQRNNVVTMLATAHHQMGLNALREDRLDDAAREFEAVLALPATEAAVRDAQEQLNLLGLYRAALSHWGQDWPSTIQGLKGLYALKHDYKDVQTRLHDAYTFHAQVYADQGEWCKAADEYAAAVGVFALEATVDRRDDATLQCQASHQTPTPLPPTATPGPTAEPAATPTRQAPPGLGTGRILFGRVDPSRQEEDLYVVDLAQGSAAPLRERASQPALGPGGARLAFRNLDPSFLGLGILDLRTGQVSEMTAYAEDASPTWSPSGEQVVFASNKEGDRKWRIYVVSPGAVRGEGEQWTFGQAPAWSPDGSRIAYRGCDPRGDHCAVWTMSPGAFDAEQLTSDPNDTSPSWSPDSSQVAFVSSRAGNWELYVVDVADGRERRMTNHPATDVAPTWSPDGKRLAFLSNRDGKWAVYVLEVKTGRIAKVIDAGNPYPDPVAERMVWMP